MIFPVIGSTVTVPFLGFLVTFTDFTSRLPSISLSLEVTSIVTGVSSFVETISFSATGASLTASTLITTIAVSQLGVALLSHTL